MIKFNQQEYTFWIQKDLRRLLDQKHNANVQVSTLLTCWYFFDSNGLLFCFKHNFLFTHKTLITNICFMLLYVFLIAVISRNFFLLQSFMEAAQTSFGEKIQTISLNINLNENPMLTHVLSFNRIFLSIYDNPK